MRSIEIPHPEDRDKKYRLFEILPALATYFILALPIILAIISPKLAAYFLVAYLLLWFIRAIGLDIRSLQGWRTMKQHMALQWRKLLVDLEALEVNTKDAPAWHTRNVERVARNIPHSRIKPSEVYHAVIIAFYNESRDIVEPTVKSVLATDFDHKKIILILAYEERGGPEIEKLANDLVKEYGDNFYHAVAYKHPGNIKGEVMGKGGNVTYAGRRLQTYLEEAKIDPLHVLVTTLDSDNRPDKQYFGALTYTYASTEEPKYASYQPVTMYTNNIWDAPAPMRVIATGNSFWNIVLSLRQHLLRNFSAHAQPMAALIDTDFWSVRTIVEDGHQYWRTWFRYDSKYDVYPIFVPIYQDAVLTHSYKKTLKMQFVQVRRWAWGVSDIAYFANQAFFKINEIPLHKRLSKFGRLIEGHLSWSTAPLILLLAAYPSFFLHPQSYIANQLPQVASQLQRIAMVGIFVSLFLSMRMLPPKPERYKRHRTIWMVVQWVYLPITSIIYSSFAAIYSQTRLMTGRYLGFVVTEKATKSERADVSSMMK
ncbi:glycosyltransferase family 2 protein [Candidatus Saccharibacteria bacterium]|nr:glycosyltransferase family 2 protein [Candidatus Saccharibacteria bacterium]